MGLAEKMANAFSSKMLPALNHTATIGGTSRRCLANTTTREVIIGTDGNPVEAKLSVLVIRADFEVFPVSGTKVIYPETGGRTYKVGKIRDLHTVAAWLDCIDAQR